MLMLAARMNIAKYCTRILSSLSVVKLNFLADFICAALVVLLAALEIINIPLPLFYDRANVLWGLVSGAFFVGAETCVFFALNDGPTGPVSAIISSGVVLVSILTWATTGIALSTTQIIGIVVAVSGVFLVSLAKQGDTEQNKKQISAINNLNLNHELQTIQ